MNSQQSHTPLNRAMILASSFTTKPFRFVTAFEKGGISGDNGRSTRWSTLVKLKPSGLEGEKEYAGVKGVTGRLCATLCVAVVVCSCRMSTRILICRHASMVSRCVVFAVVVGKYLAMKESCTQSSYNRLAHARARFLFGAGPISSSERVKDSLSSKWGNMKS